MTVVRCIGKEFPVDNVLVIGDVMLDCYYWGHTNRISPEAPVPVFELDEVTYVLGGAANVAANAASLNGHKRTCILMGAVGKDKEAKTLKSLLRDIGVTDYLVAEKDRPTTTKTRVVAGGQHMLRIDCESREVINITSSNTTRSRLRQVIDECGSIIISDYAKGMVSTALATDTIIEAFKHEVPVFVDPKGFEWGKYVDAFCVTPNKKEFIEFYNGHYHSYVESITEIGRVAPEVAIQYGWDYLTVTLGGDGILVASAKDRASKVVEAKKVEVADVSGAGDTVIAALASEAADVVDPIAELDMIRAAEFANAAASVAVSKLGTVAVSLYEVPDTW